MSVIDDYLKNVPEPQQKELRQIRNIIKAKVPEAEEVIGYGMPTFKYKGKNLVHFANFKDHMSLFPAAAGPTEVLKDKLEGYITSKGTIQFTLDNPLPKELIEEIIDLNVARIDG